MCAPVVHFISSQCVKLVVSSGSLPVSVTEAFQEQTPPCSELGGASLTDCLHSEPADASSDERWTWQREEGGGKREMWCVSSFCSFDSHSCLFFYTCVFLQQPHPPHPVNTAALTATLLNTLLRLRCTMSEGHTPQTLLLFFEPMKSGLTRVHRKWSRSVWTAWSCVRGLSSRRTDSAALSCPCGTTLW